MFGTTGATFASIVCSLLSVIYTIEWLLSGIAFALFVFGMTKFLLHGENILEKSKGRTFMTWGIVALFVIFSMQGILYLMTTSLLANASSPNSTPSCSSS